MENAVQYYIQHHNGGSNYFKLQHHGGSKYFKLYVSGFSRKAGRPSVLLRGDIVKCILWKSKNNIYWSCIVR